MSVETICAAALGSSMVLFAVLERKHKLKKQRIGDLDAQSDVKDVSNTDERIEIKGKKEKHMVKKRSKEQKAGDKSNFFSKKCDVWAVKLLEKYSMSYWVSNRQKQILILHPKNMLQVKMKEHLSKVMQNYILCFIVTLILMILSDFAGIMVFNFIAFPAMMAYREDLSLKKKVEDRMNNIMYQLPELFHQLSILISSGLNVDGALRNIYENSYEKGEIKMVLDKMYFEIDRGASIVNSINTVAQILNIRAFNKFSVITKQLIENGMNGSVEILTELSEDTLREMQIRIRERAEKLSSKLMMPLMLSLVGIMIMLGVPVMMQL